MATREEPDPRGIPCGRGHPAAGWLGIVPGYGPRCKNRPGAEAQLRTRQGAR